MCNSNKCQVDQDADISLWLCMQDTILNQRINAPTIYGKYMGFSMSNELAITLPKYVLHICFSGMALLLAILSD